MKKLLFTIILLLFCTQVWADSSFTSNYTLIEDASIWTGAGLQRNFGASIISMGDNWDRRQGVIRVLNMADSLPATAIVDSAYFSYTISSEDIDATAWVTTRWYSLLKDWGEGVHSGETATTGECSGDSNIVGTSAWTSDCAEGSGTDRSATAQTDGVHPDSIKFVDGASGTVKLWLTPATVEGWRTTNYGIVWRETVSAQGNNLLFHNAEDVTGLPSFTCYYHIASSDVTPPEPVTGVGASDTTASSVTLFCAKSESTDCGGYMVRYAQGATAPATYADGTFGDSTSSANDTVFGISGLLENTQYSFTVFARDEVPNWSTGGSQSKKTITTKSDDTPPAIVSGVDTTEITYSEVYLKCDKNDSADCGGYMVRYAQGATAPATYADGTFGDSTSSRDDTTFDLIGLNSNTEYSFAIFARDEVPNWSTANSGSKVTATTKQITVGTGIGSILNFGNNVFMGIFGDSTLAGDTVKLQFSTLDTGGAVADADTYFVRRYFAGSLLDSARYTVTQNKVRLGYYNVPFKAKSGSNYGKYLVELEVHKQTKKAKGSGWYEVIRRYNGQDFYEQVLNTNTLGDTIKKYVLETLDSIKNFATIEEVKQAVWYADNRGLTDKAGYELSEGGLLADTSWQRIATLLGISLDDSLGAIKQKIFAYIDTTIGSRSTFNPHTDTVYVVLYTDSTGKGNFAGTATVEDTTTSGKKIATEDTVGSLATTIQGWFEDIKTALGDTISTYSLTQAQKDTVLAMVDSFFATTFGSGGSSNWSNAQRDTVLRMVDSFFVTIFGGGTGASAAEVWAYGTRTLTSGAGTGTNQVKIITKQTSDSAEIIGTSVQVLNSTQTSTLGLLTTGPGGDATFALDAATYKVRMYKPGWQFTVPETLIVAGDTTATYWATIFNPGNPASADLCRVYGWVKDLNSVAVNGAKIEVKNKTVPLRFGSVVISPFYKTTTTNSSGYWYLDLYPSADLTPATSTYDFLIYISAGTILRMSHTVPDSTSWELTW